MADADDRKVREALDGLEAVAASNNAWATQDPAVRAAYQAMLKAMSKRASAFSLPALYCVQIRR